MCQKVLKHALARSVQPQAAAPLFAEAEAIARTLPNEYEQTWLLTEIVDALLTAQAVEAADRVARSIDKQANRAKALAQIGSAWANAGCTDQATLLFTEAETLARSIDQDFEQGEALKDLAQTLTQARRYAEAERVALTIETDWAKTKALADLAAALAQDHQIEDAIAEAERIATFIQDNSGKAFVLRVLAMVQAKAGRTAEATQLFQAAGAIAPVVEDPQIPIFALVVLGMTLKKAGHQEESEKMFQVALSAAKSIEDEIDQRTTLGAIVTDLTEQRLASEAEQFAQVIQEPLERAGTLQQVAISYALSNKKADAQRLFQEVEALAEVLKDYRYEGMALPRREGTLTGLSQALAQIGYFAEAERVAWAIDDTDCWQQSEALAALSETLAQSQQFSEAERIARSIPDTNWKRVDALCQLVVSLAQAGNETRIKELLTEAKQVAMVLDDPTWRPWAIRAVATAFIATDQFSEAETLADPFLDAESQVQIFRELALKSGQFEYFQRARAAIEAMPDSSLKAYYLWDLAKTMAQNGWSSESETLFAIAEQAAQTEIPRNRSHALKELAISNAQFGRFTASLNLIDSIDHWMKRDRAIVGVAKELAQVGRFIEANQLIHTIEEAKEKQQALGSLAIAMMRQHRFAEALDTLGTQTPDDFIHILASAAATLEQLEVGLSSPVLSHVLHIIGWVRPDWQKIATILSPLTSLAPSTTR